MAKPQSLSEALPGIWNLLKFVRPYLRKQRRALLGAFGALFLGVTMRALEPWPLKFVFDYVILPPQGQMELSSDWLPSENPLVLIALAAGALIVIMLIRSICLYYEKVGFAVVGNRVLTQVRGSLFRHIQCLSMAFHNKARSGDLLVRVMGDIGMLKQISVTAFMPMIGNVLVLAVMAILMLWLHWQLALLVLISAPLYMIPTLSFGRRIQKVSREQRKREGNIAAGTMEMIGAMQVVQTLALEDAFAEQFSSEEKEGLKEGVKFRRLLAKLRGTVQLMIGLSTGVVLFYGGYLVLQGELTAGSLLVFLSYLKAAFKPLANFTKYSGRIAKASAAGERVMDIFNTEPDVRDRPDAVEAPAFEGRIRFDGVEFGYAPGHSVLEAIDFEVEPSQLVAIVGPSGAGKSTLVEMIPRLHDPRAGRVLIDGHDIREFTLASLRSQVSFVLQDTLLFAASIRENIAYGAPAASEEQIVEAAKRAAAHDFILAQPEGYDTVVGERGVTLSVGQRQRIAVARAAVNDAPILILDEPTTGLDEENQEIVLGALTRLAKRRTTFMITHVLEHVRRADVVLVFENGRIVASGPPSEIQLSKARLTEMMAGD